MTAITTIIARQKRAYKIESKSYIKYILILNELQNSLYHIMFLLFLSLRYYSHSHINFNAYLECNRGKHIIFLHNARSNHSVYNIYLSDRRYYY